MEEKIKDPFVKTGLITMSGNVKVNIEENDAYISDTCSNFKNGKITVTTCLNQKGLIVGTFLDEFQMNLAKQYWNFQ